MKLVWMIRIDSLKVLSTLMQQIYLVFDGCCQWKGHSYSHDAQRSKDFDLKLSQF